MDNIIISLPHLHQPPAHKTTLDLPLPKDNSTTTNNKEMTAAEDEELCILIVWSEILNLWAALWRTMSLLNTGEFSVILQEQEQKYPKVRKAFNCSVPARREKDIRSQKKPKIIKNIEEKR